MEGKLNFLRVQGDVTASLDSFTSWGGGGGGEAECASYPKENILRTFYKRTPFNLDYAE